jgi:hypothetical protein
MYNYVPLGIVMMYNLVQLAPLSVVNNFTMYKKSLAAQFVVRLPFIHL